MPVLIQVLYANGFGEMPDKSYLYTYDIEAHDGLGAFDVTQDVAKAARFDDFTQAFETWRAVPKSRPVRYDGAPNRPLTALSITFTLVDDAGNLTKADMAPVSNPYVMPLIKEARRKMPDLSKDYHINICKTHGEQEIVDYEGSFTVTLHCVNRGRSARLPSLNAAGRPTEEPTFEVEAIYDEDEGKYIEKSHQLWDELEEKARELCDDDTSFWWS